MLNTLSEVSMFKLIFPDVVVTSSMVNQPFSKLNVVDQSESTSNSCAFGARKTFAVLLQVTWVLFTPKI